MKRTYYFAAAVLLLAGSAICGSAQAAANIKPEKRRSIYLTIKGPQQASDRMRELFEHAALDKELFIAEDPHQAGSKVKITISDERLAQKPLYAELLSATLVPRQGDASTVSFCKQVTDGMGYSTITTSYWVPTKDSVPANSTMWIEKERGARALSELVRKKISDAGFKMAASAGEADFRVKDIRLIKVPLQVEVLKAKVESELNIAGGSMTSLSSDVSNYLSVMEPMVAEAEGCRKTIQHITDVPPTGYEQVVSLDLALIAGRIKK